MRHERTVFFLTPDFPSHIVLANRALPAPGASLSFQNYNNSAQTVVVQGANSVAGPWTLIPNTSLAIAANSVAVEAVTTSALNGTVIPPYTYYQVALAGSVSSLILENGGTSYTSAPTVTITGGSGSGATATAAIHATGGVAGATVTAGGTLYTTAPAVTFSAPPSGTTATGVATVASGAVTGITVTNPGTGYTVAPTISFSGGGGSGAAATATLTALSGPVVSLTVTAGGSDYTTLPTVTFSGGGGTGATAVAELSSFTSGGIDSGLEVEFEFFNIN